MKTSDISKRVGLGKLVTEMGAELKLWTPNLLPPEGVVVPLIKLGVNPKGTLTLDGKLIVAYIRDQYKPKDSEPEDLNRFHVADCITLQQMKRKNRYKRYVAATRRDGLFIVNFRGAFGHGPREENVECRLYVCKHCLTRLNYKGYRSRKLKYEQDNIRDTFDLTEFFEKNASQITEAPTQTDISAPPNEYAPNWDQISRRYREKVGWMCERCSIDLRDNSEFLETHNIDGLRNNNGDKNLWALCIGCHVEQPDHQHMKSTPRYREYQQWRESA